MYEETQQTLQQYFAQHSVCDATSAISRELIDGVIRVNYNQDSSSINALAGLVSPLSLSYEQHRHLCDCWSPGGPCTANRGCRMASQRYAPCCIALQCIVLQCAHCSAYLHVCDCDLGAFGFVAQAARTGTS